MQAKNGAFCYWSLGGETDPEMLSANMPSEYAKLVPGPRTWTMALKAAMVTHFDRDEELVRPLRSRMNNGYTVVLESKGEEHNEFETKVSVKVDGEGDITVTHGYVPWDDQAKLQQLVYHFRKMLPGASVSAMLVEIVKGKLDGVALKDNGGLYFITHDSVAAFHVVRRAVEGAAAGGSKNALSVIDLECNEMTLRDIHRGISREIQAETEQVMHELAANDCGDRALSNRVERCERAMHRMKRYEQILGDPLAECRAALRKTFDALAAAQAAKDADIFEVAV